MTQNGCTKMGGSSCPTKKHTKKGRMSYKKKKSGTKKGGMSYKKKHGGSKCPTKGRMKKKTQKKKKSQKKSKGLFAGLFKL